MHYGGSISPPREPAKKKYIVPRRQPKKEMGDSQNSDANRIKESSLIWPMLTRSNYMEWAMLMQINYEALEIWDVIDPGTNPKRAHDRQAMGALMRSVPNEMWGTLGAKKTVKEAWETVKSMRVGADRVKEISVQKLLREFENIEFKEGEAVEDFGMRITNLVATLKSLGENIDDSRVVKKFLRVLPSRFNQVVVSIEMFCDMKELSVEELVGRLRAAEDRIGDKVDQLADKTGKLLLTEEEWLERHKNQNRSQSSGSSFKKEWSGGSSSGKGKAMAKQEPSKGSVKLTSEGTPRRKGRCRNCGIYGHWAEDCKRPKKQRKEEKKEEANLARADVEGGTLLLATVYDISPRQPQVVHLQEKKVVPVECEDDVWHLDTGASNHMTGMISVLSNIDQTVHGSVRFGDGSTVSIEGIGSMVMTGKNGEHKVLTNVYYIPKLQSNIISLGQLEEAGCKVVLEDGWL